MSDLLSITQENFEAEVLKSELPVLIDFWQFGVDLAKLSTRLSKKLPKSMPAN